MLRDGYPKFVSSPKMIKSDKKSFTLVDIVDKLYINVTQRNKVCAKTLLLSALLAYIIKNKFVSISHANNCNK